MKAEKRLFWGIVERVVLLFEDVSPSSWSVSVGTIANCMSIV